MKLTGGLGPPLTPEDLKTKTDDMLRATILFGRSGTPMPPFEGMLSVDDVDRLVQLIRQGEALHE